MFRREALLLFLLVSQICLAQYGHPQFNGHLSVAIPAREFAEADEGRQAYFGLGAEFSFPVVRDSPLQLGIDFRYYFMGNRDRNVDIFDTTGSFEYNLTSRVNGSMMPIHFHARIDFMNIYEYWIMPYAGGFAGFRLFGITQNFEFDYEDGSEPFTENERSFSTTSSVGFELGVHIRVDTRVLIDLRYEQAYGGRATYLDPSTIEIDDEGYVSFQDLNTRTDAHFITAGAIIELD